MDEMMREARYTSTMIRDLLVAFQEEDALASDEDYLQDERIDAQRRVKVGRKAKALTPHEVERAEVEVDEVLPSTVGDQMQ